AAGFVFLTVAPSAVCMALMLVFVVVRGTDPNYTDDANAFVRTSMPSPTSLPPRDYNHPRGTLNITRAQYDQALARWASRGIYAYEISLTDYSNRNGQYSPTQDTLTLGVDKAGSSIKVLGYQQLSPTATARQSPV